MSVSVFELVKIAIGPSSSHTVGPMKAARQFLLECEDMLILEKIASVRTELFGSLALTGRGHSVDQAIMMGLEGETPEAINPSDVVPRSTVILANEKLNLLGRYPVPFIDGEHLVFHKDDRLPHHSKWNAFYRPVRRRRGSAEQRILFRRRRFCDPGR